MNKGICRRLNKKKPQMDAGVLREASNIHWIEKYPNCELVVQQLENCASRKVTNYLKPQGTKI